jgi:hypothetical protein
MGKTAVIGTILRWVTTLVLAYVIYGIAARYEVLRVASLYLGRDTLKQCVAEKAVVQPDGHAFAICRSWDWNDGEFISAIVYDASDQIGRNGNSRSSNWQGGIGACRIKSKISLFCGSRFQVLPLFNHLYRVNFLN